MAVTWQSQPNSARTHQRRRRLASGPPAQVDPPRTLKLRPPATPYLRRRSTAGYRVASVDVLPDDSVRGKRSYALFSPYAPLPAIGGDAHSEGDPAVMDSGDGDKSPPPRPRLLRERTYSVLEPVLVRGPTPTPTTVNAQWAQPVRLNYNEAWSRQPTTRPTSPRSNVLLRSPDTDRKPSEAWSSPRETTPTQLPNLVPGTAGETRLRRPSSPEMLDDVQLPAFPHEIDLDDDDLSTEESTVGDAVDKPSDLNVTWTLPKRSEDAVAEESEEQRTTKLVEDVTDSLKRLWTRL